MQSLKKLLEIWLECKADDRLQLHERLGGGTQADSIMDRIIHNSYPIPKANQGIDRKMN